MLVKRAAAKTLLQLAEDAATSPPIDQMNALAWSMVSGRDPDSRDAELAQRLAARSVEAAPTNGTYWNTLGIAHYRAGDFSEALEVLGKAAEFQSAGHRFDESVLAMTQWQLGQHSEAQKTFDHAEDWLRNHKPHDDAQHQFYSEAAKLLQRETSLECVRKLQ